MANRTDIDAIQSQASILMKKGIQLLNETRPCAAAEALECFDRALDLRRRLPVDEYPELGYGLAACLLNRADVLVKQTNAAFLADALAAYDEAIVLLCRLPLEEDTRYRKRLGIAYQNRGLALLTIGTSAAAKAVESFSDAVAVLEAGDVSSIPDGQYLTAVAWTNLANAHLMTGGFESNRCGREAAQHAIALVANTEAHDIATAEVAIKARHIFCRTTVQHLAEAPPDGTVPQAVHEATDAVDEGLALARRWEAKDITNLRDVVSELFFYGAEVYRKFQPQFYEEFVHENSGMVRLLAEANGKIDEQSKFSILTS